MRDYLQPISEHLEGYVNLLSHLSLGQTIKIHTNTSFPDLTQASLAIITIEGSREDSASVLNYDVFRKSFYALNPGGNWQGEIVDLGVLKKGNTIKDTFFALQKIQTQLLKKDITLIILGQTQELVHPVYRSFDTFEQTVNLVSIDKKVNLTGKHPDEKTFLSNMMLEEPFNLQNYSNIGYQTYYNSQDELDLVNHLYFDAYRLGDISSDWSIAEPVFRDADVISMSVNALKTSDIGYFKQFNPNGFDGKESCALSRYAGISEKVKTFGLFDLDEEVIKSELVSQIIWYFIEGYNYRVYEYPFTSSENYYKYMVPQEDQELVFYKSDQTGRWWIEAKYEEGKYTKKTLFPCSEKDYEKALENQIPERWWKAIQKKNNSI